MLVIPAITLVGTTRSKNSAHRYPCRSEDVGHAGLCVKAWVGAAETASLEVADGVGDVVVKKKRSGLIDPERQQPITLKLILIRMTGVESADTSALAQVRP